MARAKKEKEVKENVKSGLSGSERLKRIKGIVSTVNSLVESDSTQTMDEVKKVPTTTSGSLSLDLALGSGYAEGRVVEIFGAESSGKTTLTLHAIAEQQKAGKVCAFIDMEHALDPTYAQRIGVKMDELIIAQPRSGNEAAKVMIELIKTGEVGCIVLDSVAAMVIEDEQEKDFNQANMAQLARAMSKLCKIITPLLNGSNTTVFFINQTRQNIGGYGAQIVTSGGNALKFYASQRIQMLAGEKLKDPKTNQLIGGTLKVRVVKNKVAPPFAETQIPIVTGQGIDSVADVLAVAKTVFRDVKSEEDGPFKVAGGHHYFYGQGLEKDKLGSSKPDAVKTLKENPKLLAKLDKLVRDALSK